MALRRLIRGFVALSAGYVVAKGVGFVAIVALARFMPSGELGRYATIITVVGYLQAVTNWGSDALGIRFGAQYPGASRKLYQAVFRSRFATGLLPLLSLVLGLWWYHVGVAGLLAVVALWFAFLFRADWLLLAKGRTGAVGVWVALRETSFAMLALSLVRITGSAEGALWGYAIAEWVWSVGTMAMLRHPDRESNVPEAPGPKELIIRGLPLVVVSLTALTSNKIDVPILAHYKTAGDVAAYWTAYNIMFAAMLLSAMWDRIALTSMARQVADGSDRSRGTALHYSILGGVLGATIALLMHGWARPILHVAYGGKFDNATEALSVLALALPAIYLSGILAGRLVAEARQSSWAVAAGSGAVLNLGLNLLLIPRLGMRGAALATLASEWAVFIIMGIAFRGALAIQAFAANVLYLLLGIGFALALVERPGNEGQAWITLAVAVGFLVYAIPIVTQQLPRPLRLRQPIRGN